MTFPQVFDLTSTKEPTDGDGSMRPGAGCKFLHEWTTGRAADQLRTGTSVPQDLRLFRLGPGDVVLVDEAGMAGTLILDQLVRIASTRGAVVRLLGDDRQLPAVEGGGALRVIATAPGTPRLTTLYRFRNPEEAAATLQVRTGDPAALGDIRSGALAVDDRLPSELDMADQYGVSRDVIRRAKEELAGQGWLIVLHGRGTFVSHPTPGNSK